MGKALRAGLLLLAGLAAAGSVGAGMPPVDGRGHELPSLAPMLERVLPAVVNIATVGHVVIQGNPLFEDPFFRRFFDIPSQPRRRRTQSLGSGVIVDAEKGYVLTNHHVIAKADKIVVTLHDGRSFDARLVGSDPETDVAVVQIPAEGLTAIRLGDSARLRVGDFVVAIGNPFGLGQTVTSGIVSALGRSGLGIEGYEDFIQTDASINPGNSGGPLVDLEGRLVGINTAILSPARGNVGIGFAIPVAMAREVMAQLIEYGEVRRGRLGVYIQDLTPELAQAFGIEATQGAVVAQVAEGSPAERAGLRPGDVVVAVDGRPVKSAAELRTAIGLMRVGKRVRLEVLRDRRRLTLTAVIEAPKEATVRGGLLDERLAGAVFGPIPEDSPFHGRVEGVMVRAVEVGSPAWRAGLREKDVVVSVNRRPVPDLERFRREVRRARGSLLLNVRRGDGALFILLR